ncbi:MAG TPA: DUF3592 domain-containing protein [Gemmatales bacterium]|nr:DUF3592 domain-containing protein [Gemmatales bacterium]
MIPAVIMLSLRSYTLHRTALAQQWPAVPCEILESKFVNASAQSRSVQRVLQLLYRYEVKGQSYESDSLNLLPGRFGDDDVWERRLQEQYPKGAAAICYVNPDDPTDAVFDRDHGAKKSRALWLLAFPFLFPSSCFAVLVVMLLLCGLVGKPTPPPGARDWGDKPGPPPRSVAPLQGLAVLCGPLGSQLAWLFLVGFVFVFVILDGPTVYLRFVQPDELTARTRGVIKSVETLPERESYVYLHQYDIAYEVEGQSLRATSVTRGRQHELGEEVDLAYDPAQPATARLVDGRISSFVWWHSLIPLCIVVLLALGLVGMYWRNWNTLRLLRRGSVGEARLKECAKEPPASTEQTERPGEPPLVESLTALEFEVPGGPVRVYAYEPISKRELRKQAAWPVIYDPRRPERNVLYHGHLRDLLGGREPWPGLLLCCLPAPGSLGALYLLFTVG